eukprot:TRINITY_DN9179_c0_g1_i1.p1 TRINITY_DN9179_c0_g1~~TRINITY_DN9179_c0_g1_i1.p1  ORF type:complete len:594 (+),score=145.93 TRINITY_DN9179_c0_g1_i1:42-1823(+)
MALAQRRAVPSPGGRGQQYRTVGRKHQESPEELLSRVQTLEKYRKDEEKERKKEELARKKELQAAKKRVDKEIATTKGELRKQEQGATKLHAGLNRLQNTHNAAVHKKSAELQKCDDVVNRVQQKHHETEAELQSRMSNIGLAKGKLEHLEFARQMLEKGVIVDISGEGGGGVGMPHGLGAQAIHDVRTNGQPQALQDMGMAGEASSAYEAELSALHATVQDVTEENSALKARLAEFEGTIREQEAAILELAGTTSNASGSMQQSAPSRPQGASYPDSTERQAPQRYESAAAASGLTTPVTEQAVYQQYSRSTSPQISAAPAIIPQQQQQQQTAAYGQAVPVPSPRSPPPISTAAYVPSGQMPYQVSGDRTQSPRTVPAYRSTPQQATRQTSPSVIRQRMPGPATQRQISGAGGSTYVLQTLPYPGSAAIAMPPSSSVGVAYPGVAGGLGYPSGASMSSYHPAFYPAPGAVMAAAAPARDPRVQPMAASPATVNYSDSGLLSPGSTYASTSQVMPRGNASTLRSSPQQASEQGLSGMPMEPVVGSQKQLGGGHGKAAAMFQKAVHKVTGNALREYRMNHPSIFDTSGGDITLG